MMTVKITPHFTQQAVAKGFESSALRAALTAPERITPVRAHPGQIRLIAAGVAVVCRPDVKAGTLTAITVYADGVLTPPRADQMSTPQGRRYAQRYATGQGRG